VDQTRKKTLEKVVAGLQEWSNILESIKDEESDAFENKPESLRTEDDQSNMDNLQEAHDGVESAITNIEEIIDR
jgi:hypothetical protein